MFLRTAVSDEWKYINRCDEYGKLHRFCQRHLRQRRLVRAERDVRCVVRRLYSA